ncbi:MAG: threonine--tRNA ligase [Candidatus Rokubacteria bacterium GWC2_70_24]|nr:MAG: threonine--tRNA ligase [Candidatus Rokubacteria bacterium GWA2_70_23]OGK86876.1 MAG: threonine--tRNA ligase [Candidatus Rokubacteria bacterium GWC2_70_24]OGK91796.1 MAG: threonine--tRNA ligase [Candidatus Rokubacteria bacterium GWF2_70_14]
MAEQEEDRHLKLAGDLDCIPEPLPTLRHSTSHVMAQAVKQLFPEVRVAIGPAIEDGFYYDFRRATPFTPEDLARVEARMRELVKADLPFVREEWARAEAIRHFKEQDEPFKVEILEGLDVPAVSVYRQGDFLDLCRGPHVRSTRGIKAFKLLSSSGAYWRGDERNPMLQRIYGTAWLTQEDLDTYLWRLEEAKKRDHRKLGRELDLFDFHDVAPGAPFWLPNGMILVRELEKFAREHLDARGYQEISTPLLIHKRLWEESGHWEHYSEHMFKVEVEEEIFTLKPMNCPPSTFVYRRALRSYRDLPLRFSEMGRCHRNERSGTLTGLVRVRQFTQDDAHIYCRPDQLQAEIVGILDLVREWYKTFNLQPTFKLSTRPEKKLGAEAQWDAAEHALAEALKVTGLAYDLNPGDGAFYGPKIDIYVEDVLGRSWQIATVQVDLVMLPERFKLEYIDRDGQPKRPVAIHRAIFGSYERFIGILTEHFAGAFPTWLAPVQARVLPVSEKHLEYARVVFARLREARIRAELDDRNEKLGYRIREAQVRKVPYMLVVGEREAQNGTASVRRRTGEDAGAIPVERIVSDLAAEIGSRSATLTVGRSA